ncbi:hypothetical protein F511_42791 [Dorcoceras hygrometricum]|uniref:Uncharacterized protein n=1 Tax=Dorcoceras hygrometricum TaxID=472368 RepID=A0A2Z7B9V1_9LAMI|nr:hypothetical protein F511_42791 [Dorcoceras hygrometricum]
MLCRMLLMRKAVSKQTLICSWKFGYQILRLPFFQNWKASTRRFDQQTPSDLGLIHCPNLNSLNLHQLSAVFTQSLILCLSEKGYMHRV